LNRGAPVLSRFVEAHLGEGDLADALTALQNAYPDIDIGSYPFFRDGRIGLSVVAKGTDQGRIDAVIESAAQSIRDLGCEPSIDAEAS